MKTTNTNLRLLHIFLFALTAILCKPGKAAADTCEAKFIFKNYGYTVDFYNISKCKSGQSASSLWNFGDGDTSHKMHPSHSYVNKGLYKVTLVVIGLNTMDKDTFTDFIYSQGLCDADFGINQKDLDVEIILPTVSGSIYTLYYGDGTITDEKENKLKYSYKKAGTYNVCLKRKVGSLNCSDSVCKTITVKEPVYCSAKFNILYVNDSTVDVLLNEDFPGKDSAYYEWDFGDGIVVFGKGKTELMHGYAWSDSFKIKLKVVNSIYNCTDSFSKKHYIKPGIFCRVNGVYAYWYEPVWGKYSWGVSVSCGRNPGYKIIFDFGDGEKDSAKYGGEHTYKKSGTYIIKAEITYSNGAKRVFLDTITVNGACNISLYRYQQDLTVNLYFERSYSSKFTIDHGDGVVNGYTGHIYSKAGTYKICILKEDTLLNCSDTACLTVTVTDPVYCYSHFKSEIVNAHNREVYFYIHNYDYFAGKDNSFYEWDFGNGQTYAAFGSEGYHNTPLVKYANDGVFKITLKTVNTKHNCTDTFSRYINIKKRDYESSIEGWVSPVDHNSYDDSALVNLYKQNPTDSSWILYKQFVTPRSNMHYYFKNVPLGKYLIRATVRRNIYNNLPTYGDSALTWDTTHIVEITGDKDSVKYVYIYMQKKVFLGGSANGIISGKVMKGANKEGEYGKEVILFDEKGNPVDYVFSNLDGLFNFNVPLGKYEVYVEIPGLKTNSLWVEITNQKLKSDFVEARVYTKEIIMSFRKPVIISIDEDLITQPNLYPNPVKNTLYLETELRKPQNVTVSVFNITELQIYTTEIHLQQGKQTINIETRDFPAGLYMLYLKNASGATLGSYKFIKAD